MPTCLDLYCGGMGSAEGMRRAGWDVTGVDFVKRRDRAEGVTFIKADVRDVLHDVAFLRSFDLVTASPPCKVHTRLVNLTEAQGKQPMHPDLIEPTRAALVAAGVPYILENVPGASLRPDVMLCGSMFGLRATAADGEERWLKRHRLFELGGWGNYGMFLQPVCQHPADLQCWGVFGKTKGDHIPGGGQVPETTEQARTLMGAPWMSWASLTQAIPPAYMEYLGTAALEELGGDAARRREAPGSMTRQIDHPTSCAVPRQVVNA